VGTEKRWVRITCPHEKRPLRITGLIELSLTIDKFKISINDKKTKVLAKNKKQIGAGQENR